VRRRIGVALALAGAGLMTAAPALADQTITAGPVPNTYATSSTTMDQGEAVLFKNSDSAGAMHDVTADTKGADGKPLFKSELIEPKKSSPVAGVEYLTTGSYKFHCSIHDFMTGTINVTANGTPKPRPAPDTTPPTVGVRLVDTTIAKALKRGGLRVRVESDEPTRFKLTATAASKKIASGQITIGKGNARTGTIRLTAAGRKLLKGAKKKLTVRLAAAANDASDNRAGATATRSLKP
jgi:plastocyanin